MWSAAREAAAILWFRPQDPDGLSAPPPRWGAMIVGVPPPKYGRRLQVMNRSGVGATQSKVLLSEATRAPRWRDRHAQSIDVLTKNGLQDGLAAMRHAPQTCRQMIEPWD